MYLEDVLADERAQAAVLRRNGYAHDAELIERVCDRVERAAEDYVTWLSEPNAQLRSGRSTAFLRGRFAEWEAAGHARKRNGRREYRQILIDQRRVAAA
jgi:hypothetical protein